MATESRAAPLRGLGVVVTRDEDEEGRLTTALEERGARVLHWPTIEPAPPEDVGPLRAALERLDDYDWLVLTSRRAVAAVVEHAPGWDRAVAAEGGEAVGGPRAAVAVVGPGTAAAASDAGLRVDLVADPATGEALIEAMGRAGVGRGSRVLFPASAIARPTVPEGLRAMGAEVDRVTAYRIVPAALDGDACARAVEGGEVRVVTLTSPSSAWNLRRALGEPVFAEVARAAVFAAIGPTTGAAAREAGAVEVIEATEHTFEGLAERVVDWVRNEGNRGAE